MANGSTPNREYMQRKGDWVALWEVMADPVRFAFLSISRPECRQSDTRLTAGPGH